MCEVYPQPLIENNINTKYAMIIWKPSYYNVYNIPLVANAMQRKPTE